MNGLKGVMTVTQMDNRRAATVQEIKDVARQLVAQRADGVSLRAVAREMGITAPALYRYFPSYDDLVRSLVGDLFGELCTVVEDARDAVPVEDPAARLIAVCRAFRAWSVGHRAEFGLLFDTPLPGPAHDPLSPAQAGGARFGRIVFDAFAEVWRRHHFTSPQAPLDPELTRQLAEYRQRVGGMLADGPLYVVLRCWTRLFGLVSLEVFDHLRFALDDAEPFFETELRAIALRLGMPTVGVDDRLQTIS